MRLSSRIHLPREHGAWGMFLVPWLAGALTARGLPPAAMLLALAGLLAFVARQPLTTWLRARRRRRQAGSAAAYAAGYAGAALALGAAGIGLGPTRPLLAVAGAAAVLGGIHLAQAARLRERTLPGELVAVTGGALAAPAAHLAGGGGSLTALILWLLCALYFASSVFYIKLRVGTAHPGATGDPEGLWRRCAAYHGFLVLALGLLLLAGQVSLAVGLAFAAVVARAAWFLARPHPGLNLRRLGLLEVAYSAGFLIFLVAGIPGAS